MGGDRLRLDMDSQETLQRVELGQLKERLMD